MRRVLFFTESMAFLLQIVIFILCFRILINTDGCFGYLMGIMPIIILFIILCLVLNSLFSFISKNFLFKKYFFLSLFIFYLLFLNYLFLFNPVGTSECRDSFYLSLLINNIIDALIIALYIKIAKKYEN